MATHSSVLAWRIPGTGEPGGLQSMGSHRVGHDWSDLAVAVAATVLNRLSQIHAIQSKDKVCVCMLSCFSHAWLFATLWTVACQAPLSMESPGKNTGVGCHALLQGIFLTEGLDPSLFSCIGRQAFYHLSTIWEAPQRAHNYKNLLWGICVCVCVCVCVCIFMSTGWFRPV